MYARLLLFKLFNTFLLVYPFSLALSIVFGPIRIGLGLGPIWPWATLAQSRTLQHPPALSSRHVSLRYPYFCLSYRS